MSVLDTNSPAGTDDDTWMPIVEYKPDGIEPLSPLLAELGVTTLQGASFNQLLDDAARLTADGM